MASIPKVSKGFSFLGCQIAQTRNDDDGTIMRRSKSSDKWLKEHFKDEFVKAAQAAGYRSRAVYKLKEIQARDDLIKSGMTVVDLGAAPGGWSQVAAEWIGESGQIFALDILEMPSLAGVKFIQGDFTDEAVFQQLLNALGGKSVDVVLSDMAPNMSGNKIVDQPRSVYLMELAMDFASRVLKPNGTLLMKAFQGEGYEAVLKQLKQAYTKVISRKPKASRARSREMYLLAIGFRKPGA